MQVEIQIDKNCREPKIVVITDQMDERIREIVRRLSEEKPAVMAGFQGDAAEILDPDDIYRVYAANGKVYAETSRGEYVLRMRLYEAEERLGADSFVRISNSEIINLKKVKNFDLSFAGVICAMLSNGTVTYVSRRQVSKIKKILGI